MKSFKKDDIQFQKYSDFFPRISDDQAHEQNNKVIKGSGGALAPLSL